MDIYDSLTCTVNVTVFVSSTFDRFDGCIDGQNGCATHFAHQVSISIGAMLNLDGDFDGHGADSVTHKQIFSGGKGTNVTPLLRLDITQGFCSQFECHQGVLVGSEGFWRLGISA